MQNCSDPASRNLISHSTWPRLVGTAGNCLTCSGLLFLWMGMATGNDATCWFVLAGISSGIGSSIQIAQCEIILAQYFRIKHLYLSHISYMAVSTGFILAPILISYLIMRFEILQVILVYQCIILQGLIVNIAFKKPQYLKSKMVNYHYVTDNVEDEYDIFSKSLTELKIKTKDIVRKFELKHEENKSSCANEIKVWETFEDEKDNDETNTQNNCDYKIVNNNSSDPVPLFNESSVNMNTTYAFDDDLNKNPESTVFAQSIRQTNYFEIYKNVIKQPSFYKSLLTVVTTRFSIFTFFTLYPTYIYLEVDIFKFKTISWIVGCLSISSLIFSGVSYWVNVTKDKKPIFLFSLCWLGSLGYFLLTMTFSKVALIFGGLNVILSIACLQHIGNNLMGLTIRGESSQEYVVLSVLTGLLLLIFIFIDTTYKNIFLLMALLHIVTGLVWVANYFYKNWY